MCKDKVYIKFIPSLLSDHVYFNWKLDSMLIWPWHCYNFSWHCSVEDVGLKLWFWWLHILFSLLGRGYRARNLDPTLIWPCADRCCCCFPEGCKEPFRCGIGFNEEIDQVPIYYISETVLMKETWMIKSATALLKFSYGHPKLYWWKLLSKKQVCLWIRFYIFEICLCITALSIWLKEFTHSILEKLRY